MPRRMPLVVVPPRGVIGDVLTDGAQFAVVADDTFLYPVR